MRRLALTLIGAGLLLAPAAYAQEDNTPPLPRPGWSFDGPFGTYDRAALQRGFQIYQEVCSNCHSLSLVTYDDLGPDGPGGGLGFTEDQVKAIAAQKEVTDGPNDQGDMFQRPARPSDHFVPAFPNDQANRAAHNGALPPDQSLIVKERGGGLGALPWAASGPDYVYGILTGFKDPPAGEAMPENSYYNLYFPGHHIAMPPPLSDDVVTYADGTKATVAQEAHDVVTFLTWAAEPTLEDRKRNGAKVLIFLVVLTGILYAAKRKIWAEIH
jgi:ubiquinol-cytochrome c reductase cytochrome c1 subunit